MSKKDLGKLQLLAFDVDGVFTDGRFYLSDEGIESKAFHTQDGYGVRCLLKSGVEVAVISGRSSGAVAKRMAELKVRHVVQGCSDKVAALNEIIADLGISAGECGYVGDDIPDLPLLQHVGHSFAVANAVQQVRDACDVTTSARGGFGAVREICELVLGARGQHS